MTNVLIVGGGIGGVATAIALSRQGLTVDLVERNASVRALGSGITLIAPAMRALQGLGVFEECARQGYGADEFLVLGVDGAKVHTMALPSAVEGGAGIMGIMRPALHRILVDHALAQGITIRTGMSPVALDERGDAVSVTFADGTTGEYDLVVGADGIWSSVRTMVFGEVQPDFQAQACIRAVFPRPEEVTAEIGYVGHPTAHIGFTPTGAETMYLYCCVPAADTTHPAPADLPAILRGHLADFGGVAAEARELITDDYEINYTPHETMVMPAPWHRGRVVLVGDSAHSTTPQLAAGAAMCLEDALALGEALAAEPDVPAALAAYSARRYERCRYVVETSGQLAYWQTHPGTPGADQEGLRAEAFELLARPF